MNFDKITNDVTSRVLGEMKECASCREKGIRVINYGIYKRIDRADYSFTIMASKCVEESKVIGDLWSKNVSLVYKDAIVMLNMSEYYMSNPVILHRTTVRNMGEKIQEIKRKVQELYDGKLKESYQTYIGNGYFFHIEITFNIIQIAKYNSVLKDCFLPTDKLPCFTFSKKDFNDLMIEWEDIAKHLKLHEMQPFCSPKRPCSIHTCYNCKI